MANLSNGFLFSSEFKQYYKLQIIYIGKKVIRKQLSNISYIIQCFSDLSTSSVLTRFGTFCSRQWYIRGAYIQSDNETWFRNVSIPTAGDVDYSSEKYRTSIYSKSLFRESFNRFAILDNTTTDHSILSLRNSIRVFRTDLRRFLKIVMEINLVVIYLNNN